LPASHYRQDVGTPGWDNAAWKEIRDYEQFWTPFDNKFQFRAGMDAAAWPAIIEPAGAVTLDLAPIFQRDETGFAADEDAINQLTLEALTDVLTEETALVALDWQHPSYWFWPHRQAAITEPWRVPQFPNGDYHILVTQDLMQGTFGHPWEQTLCVFGRDLVGALAPRLTAWLPVKRSPR
jgi:Protein of unknown function (DUF2716)